MQELVGIVRVENELTQAIDIIKKLSDDSGKAACGGNRGYNPGWHTAMELMHMLTVAEAIARSTDTCLSLGVANVAIITGEGMSGGAIAITTANRVLMLEHAIYSVISPEGAASILWRDTAKAQDAATSMKITASDLASFGIIDAIVSEPVGGAHRDPAAAIAATGEVVASAFAELKGFDRETIRRQRRDKFLAIGRSLE